MKMNRLLLICILPVLFSACNSWLDVQPEEQISEDEVFSTGNGYRNVLNGVSFITTAPFAKSSI